MFLGHSVTQNKNVSESTAQEIDREIKAIIDHAYASAKSILTENLEDLHRIARGLLEYETLSGDEIRQVLRGEPVIKAVVDDPAPETRRASVPTTGKAAPLPPNLGAAPAPGLRLRQGRCVGSDRGLCPFVHLPVPLGLGRSSDQRQLSRVCGGFIANAPVDTLSVLTTGL